MSLYEGEPNPVTGERRLYEAIPPNPTLWQTEGATEGRKRRDRGVRNVELAEHREDRNLIDRIILMFADGGHRFTADDVRPYLPLGIRDNSIGAAFLRAAKKGVIEECGVKRSERPEARARKVTVWVGSWMESA